MCALLCVCVCVFWPPSHRETPNCAAVASRAQWSTAYMLTGISRTQTCACKHTWISFLQLGSRVTHTRTYTHTNISLDMEIMTGVLSPNAHLGIAPQCISTIICPTLASLCRSAHPLPSPGFEAHFRLKSCTPLPLIIKIETNWAHPCRRCSRLFARTHFLRRWGPILFQLIQLWDSPFPFPVLPSSH